MTAQTQPPNSEPPLVRARLAEPFGEAETPPSEFKIGGEAEKFGVDALTGAPVGYDGERPVLRVFEHLIEAHGWQPVAERDGGPVIMLTRGQASITLEPGAQLELSGAPLADVHQVHEEMRAHLAELAPVSRELGVVWLGTGFHPFARVDQLPEVPKARYSVMKAYLPKNGPRALDMMWRTATVQANFDYANEADALLKLCTMTKLSPVFQALTANAPLIEGRLSPRASERAHVWTEMSRDRSGLIPQLFAAGDLGYGHYIDWALDAGMFLFKRDGRVIHNTGQTFRSFLSDGFDGHRATMADWRLHLQTLFPEVRLKNTLEVRSCDGVPARLYTAVPALLTGLLYDETALGYATERARSVNLEAVSDARARVVTEGLRGEFAGRPMVQWAEELIELSAAGLGRRARLRADGRDEGVYLDPLRELVEHAETESDRVRRAVDPDSFVPSVIAATAMGTVDD